MGEIIMGIVGGVIAILVVIFGIRHFVRLKHFVPSVRKAAEIAGLFPSRDILTDDEAKEIMGMHYRVLKNFPKRDELYEENYTGKIENISVRVVLYWKHEINLAKGGGVEDETGAFAVIAAYLPRKLNFKLNIVSGKNKTFRLSDEEFDRTCKVITDNETAAVTFLGPAPLRDKIKAFIKANSFFGDISDSGVHRTFSLAGIPTKAEEVVSIIRNAVQLTKDISARAEQAGYSGMKSSVDNIENNTLENLLEGITKKSKSGDFGSALKDSNEALKIIPDNPQLYFYRGLIKGWMGDIKGKLADMDKVIELGESLETEHFAAAYEGRGKAKEMLRDYRGAIDDWKKAIDINPSVKTKIEPWIAKAQPKVE